VYKIVGHISEKAIQFLRLNIIQIRFLEMSQNDLAGKL
jgi:hypothetical protein